MITGFATSEHTAGYKARFPKFNEFFREAQGLTVSSVGIGSYLGKTDASTDHAYEESMRVAIRNGINFVDTSLNYREQRSERNIGAAIEKLVFAGRVDRGEFVVATKAGYFVPGAIPPGAGQEAEVVDGNHSLSPGFLMDQLERSRRNLGLATIDILYLHNPETQLSRVGPDEFYRRVTQAFEVLEEAVSDDKIRFYGAATWTGFRQPDGLSLRRLEDIARSIAGHLHKFRFIQLPLNLAMPEALHLRDEDDQSVLDAAVDLDISVVASASILQSRLADNLPAQIRERLNGLATDAQRAIQFTRSTPGIDVALVGMSKPAHVVENLGVAEVAPVGVEDYLALFRQ